MKRALAWVCLAFGFGACATSPLGRSQLVLFPDSEMSQMGVAAFDQMKKKTPQVEDPQMTRYVGCVAQAVAREAAGRPHAASRWDVVVFKDDTANAFALPGGKIGVHSGLLKVAKTPDQLATVLGHEVAHVLANHSNERVSTNFATQSGLQLGAAMSGASGSMTQQALFAALGLGAQVGVLLPFSRAQEREADLVGLDLMAAAGFNPDESIQLWRNMEAAGGGRPPEFLSTHPGTTTRIQDLRERLSIARPIYERARATGKQPQCR